MGFEAVKPSKREKRLFRNTKIFPRLEPPSCVHFFSHKQMGWPELSGFKLCRVKKYYFLKEIGSLPPPPPG